jgi:TonB-dependent SusC/RagA subfamily outer membrane receptor
MTLTLVRRTIAAVAALALPLAAGCASSGTPAAASPGGSSGTRVTANGGCLTPNSLSQADYGAARVAGVEELLRTIPGVNVIWGARGFSVQIRGTNTLTAGSEPLYLIDGMPFVGTQNSALPVNTADIECVEVLKDVAHTGIFGVRGANGVVLITTRRGAPDGR